MLPVEGGAVGVAWLSGKRVAWDAIARVRMRYAWRRLLGLGVLRMFVGAGVDTVIGRGRRCKL